MEKIRIKKLIIAHIVMIDVNIMRRFKKINKILHVHVKVSNTKLTLSVNSRILKNKSSIM